MLSVFRQLSRLTIVCKIVVSDFANFCAGLFRSRTALPAENLFLRKQLALFREREKRARPTKVADRFVFSKLARLFDWRSALVIVKPATLIGWHRAGFRRSWRRKSRRTGRPSVSREVIGLIRRMAAENPTWCEERIADELLLKLQIRLSPRTVGKYVKRWPRPHGAGDQRWSTFVRNHAQGIVACDFFVAVTAHFRIVYVFVALEIGFRRSSFTSTSPNIRQLNGRCSSCVKHYPATQITSSFCMIGTALANLDETVESWGIRVLRSPVRMPTANAYCERVIGSMRRECLDYVIPLSAWHLRPELFVTGSAITTAAVPIDS